YLRGVAPPDVKTVHIYRGVIAFIVLQLVGLAIVGFNPALVNYLPNRTYLTSVTAPPPQNPRLQECLESYLAEYYDDNEPMLRERIANMRALDTTVLPEARRDELAEALDLAEATFERMDAITAARAALDEYAREYRPLHREVRSIQAAVRGVEERIADAGQRLNRERRAGAGDERLREIEGEIETIESDAEALRQQVPAEWEGARELFLDLAAAERTARLRYRRNVDDAYAPVQRLNRMLSQAGALAAVEEQLTALDQVLRD